MSEEQGKTTNQVISDATVQEVIPAKPTALSDEDLNNVAGGQSGAGGGRQNASRNATEGVDEPCRPPSRGGGGGTRA